MSLMDLGFVFSIKLLALFSTLNRLLVILKGLRPNQSCEFYWYAKNEKPTLSLNEVGKKNYLMVERACDTSDSLSMSGNPLLAQKFVLVLSKVHLDIK